MSTIQIKNEKIFGERIGLMAKLFGCWHNKDLSRPFKNQNRAYRVCLECGARRAFDTQTLETFGPFYFPPAISLGIKN